MSNPIESPATSGASTSESRQTLIALIPFVIAISALILAVVFWNWSPGLNDPDQISYGAIAVGAILAFDLPVCLWIVIHSLATGEPPELSLSPLIPTKEEREFRRALRERPKLNDDDFYDAFYADSNTPRQLTVQLRTLLENAFGLDFAALHPTDNLIDADVELDWADIVFRIDRELNVAVPHDFIRDFDGTFDSLLRRIVEIMGPS
jgi:hypothetical protein